MRRSVKVEELRVDGGTQARVKLNRTMVREYAEAMSRGDKFPPVEVFYDGTDYWLVDGFHRYRACELNGAKTIRVKIHEGSREEAVLYSLGVNAAHGLRRTNADKKTQFGRYSNIPSGRSGRTGRLPGGAVSAMKWSADIAAK